MTDKKLIRFIAQYPGGRKVHACITEDEFEKLKAIEPADWNDRRDEIVIRMTTCVCFPRCEVCKDPDD